MYFNRNILPPEFVLLTWNFQSSFNELCLTVPGSFSLLSFSLSVSLLVTLCICIYEFYSIKSSHFTETKIYAKHDLNQDGNVFLEFIYCLKIFLIT